MILISLIVHDSLLVYCPYKTCFTLCLSPLIPLTANRCRPLFNRHLASRRREHTTLFRRH